MLDFQKIWNALFSVNSRFAIRTFALLLAIYNLRVSLTRITPNTDTFYAMLAFAEYLFS